MSLLTDQLLMMSALTAIQDLDLIPLLMEKGYRPTGCKYSEPRQ
eukprot:SAG11_NODE_372_length_10036_cov_8.820871_9_plen_44_part_00